MTHSSPPQICILISLPIQFVVCNNSKPGKFLNWNFQTELVDEDDLGIVDLAEHEQARGRQFGIPGSQIPDFVKMNPKSQIF